MKSETVVFRKWKNTGTLIALFPELPADIYGRYCDAYEHVGQHGGADYHGVIQQTMPVELFECKDLIRELENFGYVLRPITRVSQQHHEKRRQTAREFAAC